MRLLAEKGCLSNTRFEAGGGAMAELEDGIQEIKRRWPGHWAPCPKQLGATQQH